MRKSRTRRTSVLAAGTAVAVALATPALAAVTPQLSGPRTLVQKLADPAATAGGSAAGLGSAMSPDEDLADALMALAAAPDSAAVAASRQRAIDILEGNPIAGRAYSGIPLLAFNNAGKVKTVPAGGSVTVREIRFGDRIISDTAALRFDNPALPFTIVYRIAELGGTMGGLLTPVPLGTAGTAVPAAQELLSTPIMETGTTEINRSHVAGAAEMTRGAVQDVRVSMPAPNAVAAIIDPSMRPGRPALATLLPATPERIVALDAVGGGKPAAIGLLSDIAPAKQLWSDLTRLNAADLAAARALGAADVALLRGIRTHMGLPAGVPGSGLTVALAGNEAFSSHRSMPLSGAKAVSIENLDGVAHQFSAAAFTAPVGGTNFSWGRFSWQWLGSPVMIPAHTTIAVTVPVPAGTFALWLGDVDSGDQASIVVMNGPPVTTPPPPAPPAAAPVVNPSAPPAPVVNSGGPGPGGPIAAPAPAPAPTPTKGKAVKAKVVRKRVVRRTVAVRSARRIVRSVRRVTARLRIVPKKVTRATQPAVAPATTQSSVAQPSTIHPPVHRF